jgi:hypothetical protein
MVLVNIGTLTSLLADELDIPGGESNLEIAYIDASDGKRRVLPRTESLEIGVRLLVATRFLQERMVEILLKSVQTVPPASLSPLQSFFYKLGLGQMDPGFSSQPTIILAEGRAKVDNANVTTASPNTGGQGLINNATIIGIVVAIVIASTCACCLIFYRQVSTFLGRIRWVSLSRKSQSKENNISLAQASANRFPTSDKQIGDFNAVQVQSGIGPGRGTEKKISKINMNRTALAAAHKVRRPPIIDTPKRQETNEEFERKIMQLPATHNFVDDIETEIVLADNSSSISALSHVSRVASVGELRDSRIDALVIGQQNLLNKLDVMLNATATKKHKDMIQRGVFSRTKSKGTLQNGLVHGVVVEPPSLWSPQQSFGRTTFSDVESAGGGIQLSTSPNPLRAMASLNIGDGTELGNPKENRSGNSDQSLLVSDKVAKLRRYLKVYKERQNGQREGSVAAHSQAFSAGHSQAPNTAHSLGTSEAGT